METLEKPKETPISTKEQKTELGLVLDRSSSMIALQDSACGAFNLLLAEQRKLAAPTRASLLLFNEYHEFLVSGRPLGEVPNLTSCNYHPAGSTALLDAIGAMVECLFIACQLTDKTSAAPAVEGEPTPLVRRLFNHVRTDASFFRPVGWVCALVQAFVPPSTVRFVPVMYEDSGLATNATNAATSSTCP
jgi:hypothetical protein